MFIVTVEGIEDSIVEIVKSLFAAHCNLAPNALAIFKCYFEVIDFVHGLAFFMSLLISWETEIHSCSTQVLEELFLISVYRSSDLLCVLFIFVSTMSYMRRLVFGCTLLLNPLQCYFILIYFDCTIIMSSVLAPPRGPGASTIFHEKRHPLPNAMKNEGSRDRWREAFETLPSL